MGEKGRFGKVRGGLGLAVRGATDGFASQASEVVKGGGSARAEFKVWVR